MYTDKMSDSTTKYLLYTSLLLGSIGTYNALSSNLSLAEKTSLDSEGAVSSVLTSGDVSSSELTAMLTQMARKVDEITAAKTANTATLKAFTDSVSLLTSDMDTFAASVGATDVFMSSFENKTTDVHIQMKDIESRLQTLNDFEAAGHAVDVDSTYVTNLSKRLALVETATANSKAAAFSSQDSSETNKLTIARLKSSLETLQKGFGTASLALSEVAQVKEDMNSGVQKSAITAMTTRLNSMSSNNESFATRLVAVEELVRRANAVDVSATGGTGGTGDTGGTMNTAINERLVDVEILADSNKVNLLTLVGDVDINKADIGAFIPELQEDISLNKSRISAVMIKADTNTSNILSIVTPRIEANETAISNLVAKDVGYESMIAALQADDVFASAARGIMSTDVADVSQRVTDNTNNIGSIEDALEGVFTTDIASNSANIESVRDDANFLAGVVVRSGENVLCNGKLVANNGAEISLQNNFLKLGPSNDTNWMLYRKHGDGTDQPSGARPTKGYGFNGMGLRARVYDSKNEGFILENSTEKRLLSVRGSDGLAGFSGALNVMNKALTMASGDAACFGHQAYLDSPGSLALKQNSSGVTEVAAATSLLLVAGGSTMLKIEPGKTVANTAFFVGGMPGSQDTAFRANNNYISTAAGKQTYFRFGTSEPSVAIRDKEVKINGVDILAKVKALEARIAALEGSYVKKGAEYYINGHKDSWKAQLSYAGDDARWSTSNTRMKIRIV